MTFGPTRRRPKGRGRLRATTTCSPSWFSAGTRLVGTRRRPAAPHDPVPDHEVHPDKAPDAQVEYSLTYETRRRAAAITSTPWTPRDAKRTSTFSTLPRPTTRSRNGLASRITARPPSRDRSAHRPHQVGLRHLVRGAEGTNPNELFTRLNRDRIPLTDSELIKALVLSKSGAVAGQPGRQEEIAAQWDGFERDLRDDQFWAFLTGSTASAEDAHRLPLREHDPSCGAPGPPSVLDVREGSRRHRERGTEAFWRDVVRRHGLLGWYHDRELYHRIGYLVAIGDSIRT